MDKTLADLLKPHNYSEVARELTSRGIATTRNRVSTMALGTAVPRVRDIPALAKILRVGVAELVHIINRDQAA